MTGLVWITGASSGIGRALALRLAADGREVVGSARSEYGSSTERRYGT